MLATLDREMTGEGILEELLRVTVEDILPAHEQPLDLGIVLRDELYDKGLTEPREVLRNLLEGKIVRYRKVMEKRPRWL